MTSVFETVGYCQFCALYSEFLNIPLKGVIGLEKTYIVVL